MTQLIDSASTVDTFRDAPARPEPRHLQLGLGSQLRWRVGCLLADGAMLALAGVATAIGSTAAGVESVSGGWTLAYCALVLGLLAARGLYGVGFGVRTFDDLRLVVGATSLAAISLLAFAALAGAGGDAIDQSLRLWLYSTAYLAAGRTAIYWSRRRERSAGRGPPADPDRRGRPCRPAGGAAPHPDAAARPEADRLSGQGAARRRGRRAGAARAGRELGSRAGRPRARRRAGDHHLLDRPGRRAAPPRPPLRGARRRRGRRAAPVRADDDAPLRRPRRRPPARLGASLGSARAPLRDQVHGRPRSSALVLLVLLSPVLLGAAASRRTSPSAGRSSSASRGSAATASSSTWSSSGRCTRARGRAARVRARSDGIAPGGVEGCRSAQRGSAASCAARSLDELPQLFNVLRGRA